MGCEQNLQDPDDVATIVNEELCKSSIRDWVGQNTRIRVERMCATHDWRNHLPTLGVRLEGGLLKDDTGNHLFLSLQRRGRI